MLYHCIFLVFVVFGPERVASFPLKNRGKSIFFGAGSETLRVFDDFPENAGHHPSASGDETTKNKTIFTNRNVPEFVMEMFQSMTEDDGTLKDSAWPGTIHYFIGQGTLYDNHRPYS